MKSLATILLMSAMTLPLAAQSPKAPVQTPKKLSDADYAKGSAIVINLLDINARINALTDQLKTLSDQSKDLQKELADISTPLFKKYDCKKCTINWKTGEFNTPPPEEKKE